MLEPLAKANQSMSRHQTFTKLVTDDKDFVGMVAYTIYKKLIISAKKNKNYIDMFLSMHNSNIILNLLINY